MANARAKAEQADQAAAKANRDSEQARIKAKEVAPEFHQPGQCKGQPDQRSLELDSEKKQMYYMKW